MTTFFRNLFIACSSHGGRHFRNNHMIAWREITFNHDKLFETIYKIVATKILFQVLTILVKKGHNCREVLI